MEIRTKILILCFFAAIFSPAGIDLYIALIPVVSESYSQNGEFALSSFILGMGFGTYLSGILYDKYGGRTLLAWSATITTAISLVLYQTDSFNSLVAIRFAQGLFVAPFMLSALSIIKDNIPKNEIGPIYGKLNGFMNLIPMTLPLVSVMLFESTGEWQSSFLFMSSLTVAFLLYLLISTKSRDISWNIEKTTPFKSIIQNKEFRKYGIYPVASLGLLFMYCAFAPTIITEKLGLSATQFSLYFGFNGILMFTAGSFLGGFFQKYSATGVLKIGLCLSTISSILLIFSIFLPFFMILGLSLYAIAFIFIIASSHDLSLSTLKSGVGKANGLINTSQMLLGAILSALAGLYSHDATILSFSLMMAFMGVFGIIKIRR